MRVYEVAREFKIDPEKLTQLLRSMGVAVRSEATAVDDATVAILRARFERERRAGHGDGEEILATAIEDAQQAPKRRRRKKEDLPPAPEPELVIEAEAPVAEPEPVVEPVPAKPEKKSPFLEDLPPGAVGKAELRGTAWSARHEGPETLPRGRRCRVQRVEGLMLFVQAE